MMSQWRSFLIDSGAELEHGRVASFGNPQCELSIVTTGNVLCDLSHRGLIGARGEDAVDFLQNQLSSDVREISETHSQLSSYCSPRGRMLASLRLFRRGDTYYLSLPAEILQATLKRVRMFVLRAKVILEDQSLDLVRCGYSGTDAEQELKQAFGACPTGVDDALQTGELTVLRIPGPHPRFEIHGPAAAVTKLWDRLNVRAAPVGAAPWALLDILSGLPNIYPATADRFVPQMANLQLIGGVSFSKGCYPGQEVVARMHYLGNLKRRMYRISAATDTVPQPGDSVFAADKDTKEPSGAIVEAQPHPDGGVAALAVLRIDDAEQHQLRLWDADGAPVKLETLPYV
ncbi:MAG: YgfZ/GcvT domain-containing protein [Gammaproteobacteria bacterium]